MSSAAVPTTEPTKSTGDLSETVPSRYAIYFENEHLLKDLHGKSFRGGIAILLGQGLKFLLQTISTITLARLLKPADFGLIAMVAAFTGLVGLWTDLGLSNAVVQRAKITHAQVSALFWINCALGTGVTLVVAALSPAIGWFYHEPRLVGITLAFSSVFLLAGLTVQHRALMRRQMRFITINVIDGISMAVGIVVAVVMAWLRFGYWSILGMQIAASCCTCVLFWVTCHWRPARFQRKVGMRSMVAFGANVTAYQLLNYTTRNFDNVIIGRLIGPIALGIYSKAYGLLMLPLVQINWPLSSVMLPALSRLQDNPKEYAKLYLRATRAMCLITMPIIVFTAFLAYDTVHVMLGWQWSNAAPVFRLLAPAAVASAMAFAPNWICQSLGWPRRQLHFALVCAPVCVAGFVIGIRWGVTGVAASFSLTYTILFGAFVIYAAAGSPIRSSQILTSCWSVLWRSCVAGFVAWILRRDVLPAARPIVALVICAVVFAIVYLAILISSETNRAILLTGFSALREKARRMGFFGVADKKPA
jgi:PST family polysaccharide transporter